MPRSKSSSNKHDTISIMRQRKLDVTDNAPGHAKDKYSEDITTIMEGAAALKHEEDVQEWKDSFWQIIGTIVYYSTLVYQCIQHYLSLLFDRTLRYLMPPSNASRLRKVGHKILATMLMLTFIVSTILGLLLGSRAAVRGFYTASVSTTQQAGVKTCSVIGDWATYLPLDPCPWLATKSNETKSQQEQLVTQANDALSIQATTFMDIYEASDGLEITITLIGDLLQTTKSIEYDVDRNQDHYFDAAEILNPLRRLIGLCKHPIIISTFRDAEMITRTNYGSLSEHVMADVVAWNQTEVARWTTTRSIRNFFYSNFPNTYTWSTEFRLINFWLNATLEIKKDVQWTVDRGYEAVEFIDMVERYVLDGNNSLSRSQEKWKKKCEHHHTQKVKGGHWWNSDPATTEWVNKRTAPEECQHDPDAHLQQLEDMLNKIAPYKKTLTIITGYLQQLNHDVGTLSNVLHSQIRRAETLDNTWKHQKPAMLRISQVIDVMRRENRGVLKLKEFVRNNQARRNRITSLNAGLIEAGNSHATT